MGTGQGSLIKAFLVPSESKCIGTLLHIHCGQPTNILQVHIYEFLNLPEIYDALASLGDRRHNPFRYRQKANDSLVQLLRLVFKQKHPFISELRCQHCRCLRPKRSFFFFGNLPSQYTLAASSTLPPLLSPSPSPSPFTGTSEEKGATPSRRQQQPTASVLTFAQGWETRYHPQFQRSPPTWSNLRPRPPPKSNFKPASAKQSSSVSIPVWAQLLQPAQTQNKDLLLHVCTLCTTRAPSVRASRLPPPLLSRLSL